MHSVKSSYISRSTSTPWTVSIRAPGRPCEAMPKSPRKFHSDQPHPSSQNTERMSANQRRPVHSNFVVHTELSDVHGNACIRQGFPGRIMREKVFPLPTLAFPLGAGIHRHRQALYVGAPGSPVVRKRHRLVAAGAHGHAEIGEFRHCDVSAAKAVEGYRTVRGQSSNPGRRSAHDRFVIFAGHAVLADIRRLVQQIEA